MTTERRLTARSGRPTALILGLFAATLMLASGCGEQGVSDQNPGDDESTPIASKADHESEVDGKSRRIIAGYPNRKQFFEGTTQVQKSWQAKRYSDDEEVNHGPYQEFHPNGKPFIEGEFVDGRRAGVWKFFHENGQLRREEKYVDGKLDGQWTEFRSDGSKQEDVSFKSGKRDGLWRTYREPKEGEKADRIAGEVTYDDGREVRVVSYWAGGNKQSEVTFKYKKIRGRMTRVPDGLIVAWHENGNKKQERHVKDGQRHGTDTEWDESGKMVREVEYDEGEEVKKTAST